MKLNEMTDEQFERLADCETLEEELAILAEEGVELSDEQLAGISGGAGVRRSGSRRRRTFKPLTREEVEQIEQLHQRLQKNDDSAVESE